ncbi:hypothetical protein JQC67_05550 [Aurantibacter crassamenti]|uniref:tetratricopeptide repeat-containing sensor histidine kinase n=1 Tax=Aurantibacter crassamenti TaxID=1837375 RepID=UPI001939F9B1|nr:sensor histidine kinase [Aurantibacter crassamenti]MBM1105602.1 hypothetical protein [Aurantibacter crassamenti]
MNLRIIKLFMLLYCWILSPSFGQESSLATIDSLENLLGLYDTEFQRAYTQLDIARAASGLDSVKAYDSAHKALSFFKKSKDSFGLARAYATIGYIEFDYSEMSISENYYKKAKILFENQMKIDSSKKLIDLWANTVLNLAASIGNQGRNDEEFTYLTDLAPIVKKYENHKVLALINSNIAITFFNNGDFEKAYQYFKGNEKNYERTEAYSQFATDRLIFSSSLMSMDSLEAAKKELDNAKKILKKTPDSPRWHLLHQQLGEYYLEKEDYKAALNEYDISTALIKEKKFYGALPQQYLEYTELYKKMGDTAKEKAYMLKFYKATSGKNEPDALYALKELAKYEYQDKNYKKGMEYAVSFFNTNDSIKRDEIIQETARLEQLYQKEKKDREIAELQILNDKTDLDLEKKKSQNYLLFILLGTMLFLLVSGYLTYRNRQKKNLLKQKEQEQVIQNLKSEQDRNLFGIMMEGAEQERKRLAADLHDGLGGRLSGISIKLSKLSEIAKTTKKLPELDDILENINDSLQELRGVAQNLMPETLLKYGLKAALEDYCSTLKDKDTNIILQFYNTEEIKEQNTKLTIYRIIQELINNALKHAQATEILVQFIHDKDKIDITVEDDGIGFKQNKLNKTGGMGLTNLKNRVHFLNGKMDIHSSTNEGTSVNVLIEKI